MAGSSSAKATQRNKAQEAAGRLAYLRNARFETQGFKSNEHVPSLSEARQMHGYNLRLIHNQRPQPSARS